MIHFLTRRLRLVLALLIALPPLLGATESNALVFASPDTEPSEEIPPTFPYWEYVTQRRYEGPSVVYLGGGFALTARHVGQGEVFLEGEIFEPERGSQHTLLNMNGRVADAMIFELERDPEKPLPDWPLLPIATEPVRVGEDLLLIGFGRGRERVTQYMADGAERFAFEWTDVGSKRWGTNRVSKAFEITSQGNFTTRSFSFVFDEPFSPNATRYEAQASIGDSGGGVFVERDGEWQLAGLMISVSSRTRTPHGGTSYGDVTYAVDLTYYRDEILRWTRPACSNERDDDGDERTDFPLDPGCDSAEDRSERDAGPLTGDSLWLSAAAMSAIFLVIAYAWQRERRRLRAPR